MPKFRKKPVVIEAVRWFKNGDHPEDATATFAASDGEPFEGEGHVVRYYRRPELDGQDGCRHCQKIMHYHGWVDTLEGGHIVCPGDWIVKGVKGKLFPCKPDIFEETYDPV